MILTVEPLPCALVLTTCPSREVEKRQDPGIYHYRARVQGFCPIAHIPSSPPKLVSLT